MRVVLGIGNPGREYEGTRHNCGFMVLDELARRHGLGPWNKRWNALVCDWSAAPGSGKTLLIKPQTYVNLSGEAAQSALAFHKSAVTELLVVVDDLNLPLGALRVRGEGSAGGHNGLRDIEARIGQIYPRLRIGIGKPVGAGGEQIGHVLGRFAPDERADAEAMVAKAADAVEAWLGGGLGAALAFNGPLRPEPPRPPRPRPDPADSPPRSGPSTAGG